MREFSQQRTDAGVETDFVEMSICIGAYPLSDAFDFLADKLAVEMEE